MTDIVSYFPNVRGKILPDASLSALTWFRVGGPVDALYRPNDTSDLIQMLKDKPDNIQHMVIGVGSNLLVRDGGLPNTIIIRLGGPFGDISVDGNSITAGAAQLDFRVAQAAAQAGVGGLSFLAGIPGSIGGALRMNAGAHGTEIRDVLAYADVLDPQGQHHRLTPDEMNMSYRHNGLPPDWIFLSATFEGSSSDSESEFNLISIVRKQRDETQPIREKTGGSTFKNPAGHSAWKLIDTAGCRGLEIGGARMSDMHCNFMLNTGDATAHDLESLGETVRRRVWETHNIKLEWEIKRMGITMASQNRIPVLEECIA